LGPHLTIRVRIDDAPSLEKGGGPQLVFVRQGKVKGEEERGEGRKERGGG